MVIKGFKYFIAYKTDYENDDEKVMPLCIMLPKKKISTYRRDFDETKYMSFLIKDNKLLWKYVKVWNKGSKFIKNRFDSESLNNEKYLKSKVTSYEGKTIQTFIIIKCLKKVLIVFVYQWYWLTLFLKWVNTRVFLEECKYIVKEKEVTRHITEDFFWWR